jgi:hypothetical protein
MAIARWPFFCGFAMACPRAIPVSFHYLHLASALVLSVLSQRRHTFARNHPWWITESLFDIRLDAAILKISLCVLAHGTLHKKQG